MSGSGRGLRLNTRLLQRTRRSGAFFLHGGVAIADQAVNSLGNFLLTLLLARTLHIRDFGAYSLLFAGMMMANGLVNTVVSEPIRTLGVGRPRERGARYVGTQLVTAVLFGALGGVVLCLILTFGVHAQPRVAVVVSAAVTATAVFEALRAIGAAGQRWRLILAADSVAQAGKLMVLGGAVAAQSLSISVGFGAILSSALLGAASLYRAGLRPVWPGRAYIAQQLREHISFGKWLTLESLVFTLSTQLYLYLIALVVDLSSVGAYNAAQTMVNVVNLLWMGVTSFSISTARAVLLNQGAHAWRRWLLNMTCSLLAVVALVLLVISLGAEELLAVLFSPKYAAYAHLVPLLACASLLMAGNSLLGATFRSINMPQMGFHGKWVSAVLTGLISVPLVRHWGVTGAAVGLIITQLCWLGVYLWGLEVIHGDWVGRIDALRWAHAKAVTSGWTITGD